MNAAPAMRWGYTVLTLAEGMNVGFDSQPAPRETIMPRVPAVRLTAEFERVRTLPRRIPTKADAEAWARVFTQEFRLPRGTQALRPWQGQAIAETLDTDSKPVVGSWLALPVGIGKTLITWLLPTALDAKRPLLIVPAALREKTFADFREAQQHWRSPGVPYRVMSREELQTDANQDFLLKYQPDLIAIDEADDLSNPGASTVVRVDRCVVDARESGRRLAVVSLTGTPGRKSILNYWHQIWWSLDEGAPLPRTAAEAKTWAFALDLRKGQPPMRPGPLGSTQKLAREWYRRRLIETPGVLIVDEDSCDQPLVIRQRLAREDPELDRHFQHMLTRNRNPGGIEITDPLSRWRLDGLLGCGLYSYYDPPPPDEWRQANRAFARFVRKRIQDTARSTHPLDTEGQVVARHKDHPTVAKWLEVKPTFDTQANTKVVWVSESTIESALDWLRESIVPGVIWCGSVPFGKVLADRARLPYYGRGGRTAGGQGLHAATRGRSLVASWGANKKGFNLQDWPRQLIIWPPQSAKWLEQIIGRSHRANAKSEVVIDFLATSGGTLDMFEETIGEARWNKSTLTLTQKILRARIVRATPRVTPGNKYRWARKSKTV